MSSTPPATPSRRSIAADSGRRLPRPHAGHLLLAAVACLGGCATTPTDLAHGLPWTARREKVSEASVQRLVHHPEIAVDAVTLKELHLAAEEDDLDVERGRVRELLADARRRGDIATEREIARLEGAELDRLARRYGVPAGVDPRAELLTAWRSEADRLYARLQRDIAACDDDAALDALVAFLESDAEPSIKSVRYDPGIWAAFEGASRRAADDLYAAEAAATPDAAFESARRIVPTGEIAAPPADLQVLGATREHWDLLVRWAPIVVQESVPASRHDPAVDVFGRVTAVDADRIEVGGASATVYAYARTVPIDGLRHVQLVWTLWYPESVATGGSDAEAGHIEGITLRATLDPWTREPILFETLDACGCFHRVYPTRSLAAAAEREHGSPLVPPVEGGAACGDGPRPLLLGRIIDDPRPGERPVIRCSAGNHGIVDVRFAASGSAAEVMAEADYDLLAYDRLEHLPLPGGGVASMFHENGLVKGAQRKEGRYFVPLGMLSAGQPRQRGTQLILFDDWDFDDPDLFPHALHWPHLTAPAAADARDGGTSATTIVDMDDHGE